MPFGQRSFLQEPAMPVTVTCGCSKSFSLKDEYVGSLVKCPACGGSVRVRGGASTELAPTRAPALTPESDADPIFGRDVFLLRQQMLRINERYAVSDESGKPILFVERPAHFFRNLLAMLGAFLAAGAWVVALTSAAAALGPGTFKNILAIVGTVGFFPVLVIAGMKLARKRHVSFYTGEDKQVCVLEVLQDQKLHFINATFTILAADGTVLGQFRKNYLFNLIRRKWDVLDQNGKVVWVAREDSIILSLVRRVVPFMGLLRTNFIFQRPGSDTVLGEFRRKMTILDKYALDLTADRARAFDRRIAVALGVMLDTGERR
jgi:uncharacterized protein YxjI